MKTALDINEVLARLPGYKQIGPNRWQAHCPAHDDQNPSLSVGVGAAGNLLLFCHAGCEFEEVLSSLQQQTILNGNGRDSEIVSQERLVATYVYHDENGREVFVKQRYSPKNFKLAHKGENGRYFWGKGDHSPVLYRLPELVSSKPEEPIFIVEGEKDADRLASMGLVATTNFDGAGKWLPTYNMHFYGRTVWIIPDNDEAGVRHAQKVAQELCPVALTVKLITLPGLSEHEDVNDWLDQGHVKEELFALCLDAPEWIAAEETAVSIPDVEKIEKDAEPQPLIPGLAIQSLSSLLRIKFDPLVYLVASLVALGYLALLVGRPKSGKSWLILQAAMCIDMELPFLDRSTTHARILYFALEEGKRRIQERAKLLDWEPKNIDFAFDLSFLDNPDGLPGPGIEELENLSKYYDMIVVDPLIAALSPSANENDNALMGGIFNGIARICKATNTAIIIVHHSGKAATEDVFKSIRGASAIRGGYDVGMFLERNNGEREAILYVESRDFEAENMTLQQAENGAGWTYLGNSNLLNEIRAGKETLQAMLELDPNGEGLTVKEIASYRKVTQKGIYPQLDRLVKDGYVERLEKPSTGDGKIADQFFVREKYRS